MIMFSAEVREVIFTGVFSPQKLWSVRLTVDRYQRPCCCKDLSGTDIFTYIWVVEKGSM